MASEPECGLSGEPLSRPYIQSRTGADLEQEKPDGEVLGIRGLLLVGNLSLYIGNLVYRICKALDGLRVGTPIEQPFS